MPTITKPTRVTHSTATVIDNIYADTKEAYETIILVTDISDHFPLLYFTECEQKDTKVSAQFWHRKIDDVSVSNIKTSLAVYNWDSLTALGTNEAYTRFISEIRNLLDIYAPLKKRKYLQKIIRESCMTKALHKSSQTLHRLYKKQLRLPSTHPSHVHYKTSKKSLITRRNTRKNSIIKTRYIRIKLTLKHLENT